MRRHQNSAKCHQKRYRVEHWTRPSFNILLWTGSKKDIRRTSPIFRQVTFLLAFCVVVVALRTGWCVIYTIICLKSVCLSGDVRRLQVAILARSPREMSQTDRIVWQYILSRVRISVRPIIFFIRENHP